MKKYLTVLLVLSLILSAANLFSQSFTKAQYKKAAWMTARFYGGQRSSDSTKTPTNWLLLNHTAAGNTGFDFYSDADGSYNVAGGWSDCGDNVRFGQTNFYSGYMLLKGYDLWPAGYSDYYSQNYAAYNKAQDFSWEGAHNDPDGIPDILNEVKYATDYFIRCARNNATFYYQVGDGASDHNLWITTVLKATETNANGGEPRNVYKNPADASMASFCGATLALMSRKYRQYDAAYADTCLVHAKYAYAYAKAHQGTAGDANGGSFYGANAKWQDDYASMCTELFYATNDSSYRTEALSYAGNLGTYGYCFGYNNNDDIAAYNLATLGSSASATLLDNFASGYKSDVDANGIYQGGNTSWGPLRYNANAAFIVALDNLYHGKTAVDSFIYKQIDFILGKNTVSTQKIASGLSFVVGFNATSASHPHHRNVYLNDDNTGNLNLNIPTRNTQFGYLVGGVRSGLYTDSMSLYQIAEGGIDYSACLVGSLAYILAQTASLVPDSMSISPKTLFVSLDNSSQITVSFKPLNSYSDITFISRDSSIAKVDFNGLVSGTKSGSTYIIVKTNDGKFIDSTLCTVGQKAVTGVSISPVSIMVSKSLQMTATITPSNASNQNVLYTISDTTIATVSKTGLITAMATGSTKITVKTVDGSFTDSSLVTVTGNPSLLTVLRTQTPVVIDGSLLDSAWNISNSIAKVASGTMNNNESFGVLWDSTNLYIGVKVFDATITTTNTNVYDNDAIELYFDMNHNGGAYDASDRQWIKVVSSTNIWQKIGAGTGAVTTTSPVKSVTSLFKGGYSMEFAIPWTILGVKPSTSAFYGFDIGIDDCDGTTTRGNQTMWVGDGNDWQSTTNFGILQLATASQTTVAVSQDTVAIANDANSTASVNVTANTTWTASSNQTWLTVNPNIATNGNATLTLSASTNPTIETRVATITVLANDGITQQNITVIQAAGDTIVSVSNTTAKVAKDSGSTASIVVTSNTTWTAASNQTWLTVNSDSITGNATFTISATANPTITTRKATVTISAKGVTPQIVTVTQAAGDTLLTIATNAVVVAKDSGSNAHVAITSNTTWTATSNQTWLMVSPDSTTGNATLTLLATANPTIATRTDTITITASGVATQTVIVTQAAGNAVVSFSTDSVIIAKDSGSTANVTVSSNTTWTASSNQAWLSVSSDTITGNATLVLSASANPTAATRIDTIVVSAKGVSSQMIIVTQAAGTGTGTGFASIDNDNYLIFPNPASQSFSIKTHEKVGVAVYTICGELILQSIVTGNEPILTNNLPAGLYIVKITTNAGIIARSLVIK